MTASHMECASLWSLTSRDSESNVIDSLSEFDERKVRIDSLDSVFFSRDPRILKDWDETSSESTSQAAPVDLDQANYLRPTYILLGISALLFFLIAAGIGSYLIVSGPI